MAKIAVENAQSLGVGNDKKHQAEVIEAMIEKIFNPMTMLGVTSPDGKRITNGDSGGPLLLTVIQKDNSQQYVQIGVTSWDSANLTSNKEEEISVFSNLTNRDMLDFINKTIKNNPVL